MESRQGVARTSLIISHRLAQTFTQDKILRALPVPSSSDVNLDLVKEMGSTKGYDPIPPDNYLFFLTSEDEVQRVLAYIRSKTIRKGHRSPFAVTESGRPITKADMARACFNGYRNNAGHAWDRAAGLGLVFENDKGFLCLNGGVKMPRLRRRKGEPESSVHTTLPLYLIEKITALPEAQKTACTAHFTALIQYRDALETDALTLARIRGDQIEDNILRHYGLERKRLERKHRPELREKGSDLLQMKLLLVPAELQEFVQTTPPVRTDDKNGSVQTTLKDTEGSKELLSTAHSLINGSLSTGGRASSVESAPARPPADPPRKPETPLWHPKLWTFLKTLPIYTVLDERMFQQIVGVLREELIEQFKIAAQEATGIRKWSGYLAIARQVAARGVVKTMAAGAGGKPETDIERRYRQEIERRREEEKHDG